MKIALDAKDLKLLSLLRSNSRLSWQALGQQVHLTGQAVAARVAALVESGVISNFTIQRGDIQRHFITVFMENTGFDSLERLLSKNNHVEAAYKVSGEGCYHLVWQGSDTQELERFLSSLLPYGRYKVLSALKTVA